MPPRRRSNRNRDLNGIQNLYRNASGYYYYRHPQTGEHYGLGKSKAKAVTQAVEANLHIQGEAVTLLDRITGKAEKTVSDWCDEYGTHARMKTLRAGLGHHVLAKLEPHHISDWLDQWNDKLRMRQALLSAAKVIFGAAIGKGWIRDNPAEHLTTPTPKTERERLTLETFLRIHSQAEAPLRRAMEIAIMTAARRENVLKLERSAVSDGHLHIQHIKGGLPVRYPLTMRLGAVGWTLGEVLARCRTNTLSRYLIHHVETVGQAKAGDKWRDKSIESMFRDAREAAGIVGDHPPTFHEIRSLSIRLWTAAGIDARILAGHRTEASSLLYRDPRGIEWITVAM